MGLLNFLRGVDDTTSIQETPKSENRYSIEYTTKCPIDAIYAFLKRDYEQQGYEDAMYNSEMKYMEEKIVIIKAELSNLCDRITLRYNDDLRNIDVQIGLLESQFLSYQVTALKAKKETYMEHLNAIKKISEELHSEDYNIAIILSYKRGFRRGLCVKSEMLLKDGTI